MKVKIQELVQFIVLELLLKTYPGLNPPSSRNALILLSKNASAPAVFAEAVFTCREILSPKRFLGYKPALVCIKCAWYCMNSARICTLLLFPVINVIAVSFCSVF